MRAPVSNNKVEINRNTPDINFGLRRIKETGRKTEREGGEKRGQEKGRRGKKKEKERRKFSSVVVLCFVFCVINIHSAIPKPHSHNAYTVDTPDMSTFIPSGSP